MSVLEEPLIQIADDVPPKDDPGWQLFETGDERDRQQETSQFDGFEWNGWSDDGQARCEGGSGKTLTVVVQAPSTVDDAHSESEVVLPSVEAEAEDEALQSLCTSTRQRVSPSPNSTPASFADVPLPNLGHAF